MGHTPSGDPFQPVKIINYLCKHLCNKLKSIKTLFQRGLFLHRELWTTDCMTPLKYSWWLCTWHGYHSQRWGGGGGGSMSPVWILKRLVSVFINACRLLSALPSLSQFGRGRLSLVATSFYALLLLFGPCCLSQFTLAGPQRFPNFFLIKI